MTPEARARSATALQRATGALGTQAMARMQSELPWFGQLSAADRSWVAVVVQAGIRGFVSWFRHAQQDTDDRELAAAVFGAAPRELTGVINLQQTVDLVRLTLEVVEHGIEDHVPPADAPEVRAAVLRYAREVAFATAQVHARAAESRGAWDARLEALIVDAVIRAETDESLLSRASALGWHHTGGVVVVVGSMPPNRAEADVGDAVRRAAREAGFDSLCASQGDRLVAVIGGVSDPTEGARAVSDQCGPGPVVVGSVEADLSTAYRSARVAVAGHRASSGWPDAPRPVRAEELLAERALAGDGQARRYLVDNVFVPLASAKSVLIETLTAYFAEGGSLEATARQCIVHPNTVRYRLQQVRTVTGLLATDPRDAFTLQIALVLGRQARREL